MSITGLSSKRFPQKRVYIVTLYRTLVIILTPLLRHTHSHSSVKLCRKSALQTTGALREIIKSAPEKKKKSRFILSLFISFSHDPLWVGGR